MDLHRCIAKAIYVTGTPLSLLEHELWQDVFRKLNPTYCPPSRRVLSSTLLNAEYTEMQSNVAEKLRGASVLHLAIDGWSNLRNESILNIILYGPEPYFHKFIEPKTNRHSAEYLCEEISKVFEELTPSKFFAVISDNAANMVKCGRLISAKYKQTIWIGCLAHTLHLLIGDILKLTSIRNHFSYIVEIIRSIQKSQILIAEFRKIADEKSMDVSLHLPVKTRWGSYLNCIESFLKSKVILQNLVININNNNDFLHLTIHRAKILNEDEWSNMEKLKTLLEPIVKWITKLEGDYCVIHLAHKALEEIEDNLNNSNSKDILKNDSDGLMIKFLDRKKNALKPIHFAAAILDPNNRGYKLTDTENIDGMEVILKLDDNSTDIVEELSRYKCRRGIWEKNIVWEMAKTADPLLWWQTLFPKSVLGQAALKILSVPATSASVERSFSTFSHIHNKKRNRLNTDRAGKICFIAHNWKLINRRPATEKSSSSGGSSEDDFTCVEPENSEISLQPNDFVFHDIEFDEENILMPSTSSYSNEARPNRVIVSDSE